MNSHERTRRLWSRSIPFALMLGVGALPGVGSAQAPPAPAPVLEQPADAPAAPQPPAGTAAITPVAPEVVSPLIPPDVQLVTFWVPDGVNVEVLGPQPEPVPVAPASGRSPIIGLKVGVGYHLRVSNLPSRPGAVLYPVLEIVGHLHRPQGVDATKFPIRVVFGPDDFEDTVGRGRLVTEVVYLEDPDQALPLSLPKDEIPMLSLNPAEEPLKVASALGRVMAIVRIGNRMPTPEEMSGAPVYELNGAACPFMGADSGRCSLPCGPVCGTPPPAGRRWLPRDEFLCDGGDHDVPLHFAGDGGLRGIDPRDALIGFRDTRRSRVLPTNMVCIYAPRFAGVRTSVGPNENTTVDVLKGAEMLQWQVTHEGRQGPRKFTQNATAEASRHRMRPSGMIGRVAVGSHIELRVLAETDAVTVLRGHVDVQGPEFANNRQKAALMREKVLPLGIKTAESAVVTGIVQGAGEQAMAWKPQEVAGVEVPPNKLGMAVIKRVSAGEAEPGDPVTFVIQYRNMGNVPIESVSVVDSLLPRLEYVTHSARGPVGAVFSANENRAGSMELRWDIGTVAPGAEGYVSFEAKVR